MKWKTKDGREIPIRKMDDQHLLNAYRYCQKMQVLYEDMCAAEAHPIFGPRGDGACMAFEDEMEHYHEQAMKLNPIKKFLKFEIQKRGLKPLKPPKRLILPAYELVAEVAYGKIYKLKKGGKKK